MRRRFLSRDLEWKARVSVYPDEFASDHGRLMLEFLPTPEEERGELPEGTLFRIASVSELGLGIPLFIDIEIAIPLSPLTSRKNLRQLKKLREATP